MSFKARDFFRKVDKPLLQEYFTKENIPIAITVTDATPESFELALHEIPKEYLKNVLADFMDLENLADDFGVDAILKASLELIQKNIANEISEKTGSFDQVLYALVKYKSVFIYASRYRNLQNIKINTDRVGLMQVNPETLGGREKALAKAVSEFLVEVDGRGHNCHVDQYNHEGGVCYMLYPEDYTRIDLHYEGVDLRKFPSKPAMRITFFYYPEEGKLQLNSPFKGKKQGRLLNIFNKEILGDDTDISGLNQVYDLNVILKDDFDIKIDAKDMIKSLYLKEIRLRSKYTRERHIISLDRIVLEPNGTKDIMDILEKHYIRKEDFEVIGAVFRFEFYASRGSGVVNMTVTENGCSLNDTANEQTARKYLSELRLIRKHDQKEL